MGRPEAPRRLGIQLVAPRDARDAIAREQHEIEDRRGDADQALDALAEEELFGTAVRHDSRL
jgi:hypothetical protein